MTSAENVGL